MKAIVFSRPILQMYTISLTNSFIFTQYNTYKCQQIRERDKEYCSKKLSTTTTNGKL